MKASLAISLLVVLCGVALLPAEATNHHAKRAQNNEHHAKKSQNNEPASETRLLELADPVLKQARALSNELTPSLRSYAPKAKSLLNDVADLAFNKEKRTFSNVRSVANNAVSLANEMYQKLYVPNQERISRLLRSAVSVAKSPATRALVKSSAKRMLESYLRR